MSEADKMFEELNFKKYVDDEELKDGFEYSSYSKLSRQWRKDGYLEITFSSKFKEITILFKDKERADQLPIYLEVEELKAINKKVEELRRVEKV